MMDAHPASTALESFLLSKLSWRETKDVVIHLLRGCGRCRLHMEPLAAGMLRSRWPEREPSPEEDASYDAAISEACRRVLETLRKDLTWKDSAAKKTLDTVRKRGGDALALPLARR